MAAPSSTELNTSDPNYQAMLTTEPLDTTNIVDVPADLSTPFDYLTNSDTDADNADLRSARRWAWYCKDPTCPKYWSAWSCKSNFWLHLYETAVHRADVRTHTRVGRRELAKEWRVETDWEMKEPKHAPSDHLPLSPSSSLSNGTSLSNDETNKYNQPETQHHHIWFITGPAGCGKTTVARFIAKTMNLPYIEGDELHPEPNIDKMAKGIPLSDADRWDWLTHLREVFLRKIQAGAQGAVLVCSLLKRKYRDIIRVAPYYSHDVCVHFVLLHAPEEVLMARVQTQGHYMEAKMAHSQFGNLEAPGMEETDVISVDVSGSIEEVAEDTLAKIREAVQRELIRDSGSADLAGHHTAASSRSIGRGEGQQELETIPNMENRRKNPSTTAADGRTEYSSLLDLEGQESLSAHTIQDYSTDSGYGSQESRHLTTGTEGHKPTQAQTHLQIPTSIEEEVEDDTQSNMSVDDTASYTSSSNESLADPKIKETAQALILETIEQDEVLNPLFRDALGQHDRARVVRNLAGFLKGYCTLLGRENPTVDQKRGIIFLRHRARHFASLICDDLDPSITALNEALALERARNSAAERKARLARWISGNALSPSPVRSIPSDDEDGSEPESLATSDGLSPVLEDIRNFFVLGEPLRLFRQHFARFAAGESVQEWNTITKRNRGFSVRPPKEDLLGTEPLSGIIFPDSMMHGSITSIPERKSFRVSWRCRCNREFHSLVPTTNQRIAEKFWRRMNWNVQRDGPMVTRYFKSEWIENLVWAVAPHLLPRFTWELTPNSTGAQDLEAHTDLGLQRGLSESAEQPNPGADVNTEAANSRTQIIDGRSPIYICLYKRKGGSWRLRHAKVRQQSGVSLSQVQESQPRIHGTTAIESSIELPSVSADTPDGPNMNRELFNTLREKILGISPSEAIPWELNSFVRSWRSWFWPWKWKFKTAFRKSCYWLWRRIDPVTVSRLEFWEFKLNPVPKLVDPVKKDKLPHEEETRARDTQCSDVNQKVSSDWEFSPLIGEELIYFKGIISGDTLFHLLKYPDHANAELPIWAGLPKKIRTKLINQKSVQVPGWGFQVEHEWDSVAFVVMTCPIIIVGFVIAVVLSVTFKWPVSAGVTLALGPVTLVMYINTMLSGITKQKGLLK